MNTLAVGSIKPWYREPWPWILMSGPAAAVIAGFVTLGYAIKYQDALVTDDYYKQGLAINRTLAREQAAVTLGVEAKLMFAGDGAGVRGNRQPRERVRRGTSDLLYLAVVLQFGPDLLVVGQHFGRRSKPQLLHSPGCDHDRGRDGKNAD